MDNNTISDLFLDRPGNRQAFVELIKTAPQLTREEAIELHDSGKWVEWPDDAIAVYQLTQQYLAIPWGRFHEAVEAAIGRPVWTHEFVDSEHLLSEYIGVTPQRSMADIMQLMQDLAGPDKEIITINPAPNNPDIDQEEFTQELMEDLVEFLMRERDEENRQQGGDDVNE